MAYRANPFLERMSERATSDEEFVRRFSPKILERLAEDAFEGAVHIFRSPPGGGKTTLLRAFTPPALQAFFWHSKRSDDLKESYQRLAARQLLDDQAGPQLLGVLLSCSSGYADLPPGLSSTDEGLFRALLDCRIVLRSLRSLTSFLGPAEQLSDVKLQYRELGKELKGIPIDKSAEGLLQWAEERERSVYARLDSVLGAEHQPPPTDARFEGILWLQSVEFIVDGRPRAPKRLLMIDDVQKLRRKQRELLITELTEMRPAIPIWIAERTIALGEDLLAQGARQGRDLREYSLDEIWSSQKGQYQFLAHAQSVLDRRLAAQDLIPPGEFSQYLRDQYEGNELREQVKAGFEAFVEVRQRHNSNPRYHEWLNRADSLAADGTLEALRELYVTRILLSRDVHKRQLTLELAPLSPEELFERDSSQVQAAADIQIHQELKIPYYYGIEKLCAMATNNVEELLNLAAALFEGLQAKQVLRRSVLRLSPREQEKLLRDAARQKRDFIPHHHSEGTRAQRLLDSIGSFCQEKTFLPNAPYAPGVTGVRLSQDQLYRIMRETQPPASPILLLRKVLSECVAENLLVKRSSAASSSREGGTVFYLNRTLCAHYGLPLQFGGWQDTTIDAMVSWMDVGRQPNKRALLEV